MFGGSEKGTFPSSWASYNAFMERKEFTRLANVHRILTGGDGAGHISNAGSTRLTAPVCAAYENAQTRRSAWFGRSLGVNGNREKFIKGKVGADYGDLNVSQSTVQSTCFAGSLFREDLYHISKCELQDISSLSKSGSLVHKLCPGIKQSPYGNCIILFCSLFQHIHELKQYMLCGWCII